MTKLRLVKSPKITPFMRRKSVETRTLSNAARARLQALHTAMATTPAAQAYNECFAGVMEALNLDPLKCILNLQTGEVSTTAQTATE